MLTLPPKFEETMRHQLGQAFPDFLSSIQEPAPTSVRLHPLKNNPAMTGEVVPWTAHGRYLSTRPSFTLDPLFHAGTYYVQEASSMFLEQALKQLPELDGPIRILDLCAAPGGKSTHLLSLLHPHSLLVSNEVIRSRASVLSENIRKWGYPNAVVTSNDPADFGKLTGFFDAIVIDAPCSGEGLFRKDAEAIAAWSPDTVNLCASRQKRILADVWDALREDGVLIYSTCTYNEVENEHNLDWLADRHDVAFVALDIHASWGVQTARSKSVSGYRFYPHQAKGEGFFLAVVRKNESAGSWRPTQKNALTPPPARIRDRLLKWIRPATDIAFFQFNDLLFYVPASFARDVEFLLKNFRILYAGTNLASVKHDKLIPDHALAMSVALNRDNFPAVLVSEEEAISYLRKETLRPRTADQGFALVTHADTPLGWINVLANRTNNMYPADWRIRMGSSGNRY